MLPFPKAAKQSVRYLLPLLLYALLWANCEKSYGQPALQGVPLLPQRVPASPTAASLERYALMPVNEAAGTPNISIPLYEVKCGSLSLPLSLSYHASGIRVADQASWVGLGWVLNAGGVITRQVRGMPDERAKGFSYNYNKVPQSDTIGIKKDETLLEEIISSRLDYQPDLYSFNFQGQAGSFMRDNQGTLQCLPLQPVQISQVADTAFLLTDAHGISYWFTYLERSRSTGRPPAPSHYTSAWYLGRIVSADKADTIRLEYEAHTLHTKSLQQQHTFFTKIRQYQPGYLDRPPVNTYVETQTTTTQNTWRLRRLVFRGGEVRFSPDMSNVRQDLPEDRRLAFLTVLDRKQDTLKQIRFYHSYYGSESRLRLDALATTASKLALPPYRFTYDQTPLPERLSGSRDHWGYYNGAVPVDSWRKPATVSLLIPKMLVDHDGVAQLYEGADRAPKAEFMQAGILTAITYPTGGGQSFAYEPNTVAEIYRLPPVTIALKPLATKGPGPTATPSGQHQQVDTVLTVQTLSTLYYTIRGYRFKPRDSRHDQIALEVYKDNSVIPYHEKPFYFPDSTAANPVDPSYLEKTDSLTLDAGRYRIVLKSAGNTQAVLTPTLTYELPAGTQLGRRNAMAGGVRLRELRLQASAQAPVTIRRYNYNVPGTKLSSGYTIGSDAPIYDRPHISWIMGTRLEGTGASNTPINPVFEISFITLNSSSLTDVMGSDRCVGYRNVTVTDSSSTGQTNGCVVSSYGGPPDEEGGWKPPLPLISYAWQRDKLLEQWTYGTLGNGSSQLLARTQYDYTVRDSLRFDSFSASPDAVIQYDPLDQAIKKGVFKYAYRNGKQASGWIYLRQTRQYQYAPNDTSSYHLTTTTYHYDNPLHQQPTLVETDLSGGQHQQVRSRYVADYPTASVTSQSSGAAQAVRELQRLHAPAQLIEQTTTRITATDTLVINSQLTLSRVLAPGVVVPARQLGLRAAVPPRWRQFQPSRLSGQTLSWDARYETQVTFDRYDAQRQLTQAHLPGGTPLSYLWDAQAGQPLVKATNAAVRQVAATSFEPGAMGRWTYDTQSGIGQHLVPGQGHTGRWAYRLENGWQPSCDSLPAGTYDLSFWYQDAPGATQPRVLVGTTPVVGTALVRTPGNWQQVQVRLSLATASLVRVGLPANSNDVLIDDLVVRPVGAQLSTYTYDVLRGMTSQTGPDGRTLYYEYDGLGRLVRTRDEQGRILGQQQYHYAGQ